MLPNGLPPWFTVFQHAQRWIKAGVFEAMVHVLQALLRLAGAAQAELSLVLHSAGTQRLAVMRQLDQLILSAFPPSL